MKIDISTLIIKISWCLINKNSNLFLNTISLDLSINIKEIVLAILQVIWHTKYYLPHHVMHYNIKHNKYSTIGNITTTRFLFAEELFVKVDLLNQDMTDVYSEISRIQNRHYMIVKIDKY